MNWDETRDFLSPCFPECIRDELAMLLPGELREIRIRAERPAVFVTATRTAKLDWIPGQMQVEALTEALSGHSLFARADETRRGYLTLRGGHRMGLCGAHHAQKRTEHAAGHCVRVHPHCRRMARLCRWSHQPLPRPVSGQNAVGAHHRRTRQRQDNAPARPDAANGGHDVGSSGAD